MTHNDSVVKFKSSKANPMPFMDDAMLDLFGEDAVGDGLGALQPHEPESRSVIRRLDQLHRCGCCQ